MLPRVQIQQFVSAGFGGGRCGGCRTAVVSGQWSVASGQWPKTSAAVAGRALEGGVAGGVELHSGLWSVVSGQWPKTSAAVAGRALEGGVAGGVELQWLVVSGQWSVVCGLWSVVCGLWSVVSGLWSVVSGLWPKTSAAVAGRALEGGVAGGVELHKGGPKARPPKSDY